MATFLHRPPVLKGVLAPRYVHTWLGPEPQLVSAEVVGQTVDYVLESVISARLLEQGSMSRFLYDFRFGERGRPMVVRLLDSKGRFAWAAG
jgi:hypothetical protein